VTYQCGGKSFTGDLFSRENPVWVDAAVIAPGKRGLRVLNNRQARDASFEILKAVVSGKGLNSIATSHPRGRGVGAARNIDAMEGPARRGFLLFSRGTPARNLV
jgi:hypothetical protein